MKKLMKSLMIAAVTVGSMAIGATGMKEVQAASHDLDAVKITVNKRAFDGDQLPSEKQNTGGTMEDFGGTPLNDVTFTMYDVTEQFNMLVAGGKTSEEAYKQIQEDASTKDSDGKYQQPDYAKKIASETTKGEGQATFDNVAVTEQDGTVYKAYLFLETDQPTGVTQVAAPMVVTMPIYTDETNTELNKNIQLYPKNLLDDHVVTKTKDDKTTIYDEGSIFGYTVDVNVPTDAQTLLQIVDSVDPAGALMLVQDDGHLVTVTVDGKALDASAYTLTPNTENGGFTIDFKNPSSYIGKKIEVKYFMQMTDKAPIDQAINNNVSVLTDQHNDPDDPDYPPYTPVVPDDPTDPDPNPSVYTGGYNFIKEDYDTKNALAGAEFIVKNVEGQFGVFKEVTDQNGHKTNALVKWESDQAKATHLTSDEKGYVSVAGLNAGDYVLQEVKAPTGYALPTGKDAETSFTVVAGEDTNSDSYTQTLGDKGKEIFNVKKGILPSTGGKGIYGLLAAGLVVMGMALYWLRKNNRSAEV